MDCFETTYNEAFGSPGSIKYCRPPPPPEITKPRGSLEGGYSPDVCRCDMFDINPYYERVKILKEKEDCLFDELVDVHEERVLLDNAILSHPCGDYDDKMRTIYQTDYTRKDYPLLEYQALRASKYDPVAVPVPTIKTGLKNGYRDPTYFRYSAITMPHIGAAKPVTFDIASKYQRRVCTGLSEYQDTINKTAVCTIKAMQQFREPLPSSRRRVGEMCI